MDSNRLFSSYTNIKSCRVTDISRPTKVCARAVQLVALAANISD